MIELPVGTLPVDFLTLVMSHFRNLAGKPDGRDQGFQARITKSSVDEVREKEIAFLQGNFDNVRKYVSLMLTGHTRIPLAKLLYIFDL